MSYARIALFFAISSFLSKGFPETRLVEPSSGSWHQRLSKYFNSHLAPESPGHFTTKGNGDDCEKLVTTGNLTLQKKITLNDQKALNSLFSVTSPSEAGDNAAKGSVFITVQPGFKDTELIEIADHLELPEYTTLLIDLSFLPPNQFGCYSTGLTQDHSKNVFLKNSAIFFLYPLCLSEIKNLPIRQVPNNGEGGKGKAPDRNPNNKKKGKSSSSSNARSASGSGGSSNSGSQPPDKPGLENKHCYDATDSAIRSWKLQNLIQKLAAQKIKTGKYAVPMLKTAQRLMKNLKLLEYNIIISMPEYKAVEDIFKGYLPVHAVPGSK